MDQRIKKLFARMKPKKSKNKSLLIFITILLTSLGPGGNYASKAQPNSTKYELVKDWLNLPKNFPLSQVSAVAVDTMQNVVFLQRTGRTWTDPMPDSLISVNTIFVVDRNSGKVIQSWGANLFIMPHSITVDNGNNVWVTDVGLHQVFKFTHSGALLMKVGVAKQAGNDSIHFNYPTDIAVANDGSFYVSDGYGNSRIVKFSKTGRYLFEWGKKGIASGEFDIPHSVSLDSHGNVFVADRENNRIQKFAANGRLLKEWKGDEWNMLYALTVDRKDNLFAVNTLYFENGVSKGDGVLMFTSNLDLQMKFGRKDFSATREWLVFHDISVDEDGNIYLANIIDMTIEKFRKVSN